MPKIRVHELAKELDISSKELINFLDKLEIKDKKAASNLEDAESGTVRNFFKNPAANTAKMSQEQVLPKKANPAEKQAAPTRKEAPEKTEPTAVQKPPVRTFGEQAQKPTQQGDRPPADQRPTGQRPQYQGDRPPAGQRPTGQRPSYQGDRPPAGQRPTGQRPPYQGDRPPAGQRPPYQGDRPPAGQRPPYQGDRPPAGQRPPYQGDRPPSGQRSPYQGDRPSAGQRPTGQRPPYQGDRPPAGQRPTGQRPPYQGDRPPAGQRPTGQRPPYQGQGGRPPQGARPGGGYQGGFQKKDEGDQKDGRKFGPGGGGTARPRPASATTTATAQKPTHKRTDKSKDITKKTKQESSIYGDKTQPKQGPRVKKLSKKDKRKIAQAEIEQQEAIKREEQEAIGIKVITVGKNISVKDLAEKLGKTTSEIITPLMKIGIMATINQEIDFYTASNIADSFEVLVEPAEEIDIFEEAFKNDESDEADMIERPPVVVVMGHVDHGKTSLLDAIRLSSVTDKEAGGITQHIGAYTVDAGGRPITFLDTPGHEAFTAMRMRGAQITDIAILVVAADDGVMPQTIEAINHARAANVEIIVAINKIDKPDAEPNRVMQELTQHGILTEEWGGETICALVSAREKTGIDNLLDMILLSAEMRQLKADPGKRARGTVIESQLDKGRGPVATVLVQEGTLSVGDPIVAGACHGRIRAMINDKGEKVKKAGPSMPVEVLGLNDVPSAGDVFYIADNERQARQVAESVVAQGRENMIKDTPQKVSLDDLFNQIQSGNMKDLNIVIKADVAGSVEAVKNSLERLSNEEVRIRTIHGGVGAITESDVMLASASNAIIIGFNVRPAGSASSVAATEKVDIRLYRVIYNAIEDITAAMKGMLDPEFVEKVIGHATIRQTFKASGIGTIGGAYVTDGKITRNAKVRVVRDGIVIHEGELAALRRFKDDVREVASGYECGLTLSNFNDIKEDDTVEAFVMEEVAR